MFLSPRKFFIRFRISDFDPIGLTCSVCDQKFLRILESFLLLWREKNSGRKKFFLVRSSSEEKNILEFTGKKLF